MGESLAHLWQNVINRVTGPMHLRLLLQPAVATFFGVRAGLRDAREGRNPYLWTVVSVPESRKSLLKEAWDHVGKVFVIAFVLDAIYQYIVLDRVYVTGVIIIAVTLALIPYLVFRGFVNRFATRRAGQKDSTPAK